MTAAATPARLSAIVPAYNVERYVGAALDSLLAQTVPFDEIIVVDDGSTDGTPAILAHYARQHGVQLIRVENGGQGLARNRALARARGDFVYFFDADDVLDAGFVAAMQALLAQHADADIVYFSGQSFADADSAGVPLPLYRRGIEARFTSGIEATGALLTRGSFFASPCLYLSRRSLWGQGGLAFEPIVHEDEEIITRLGCAAGAAVCVDAVYFARRVRAGSTMTQAKTARHAAGYLHALASLAAQLRAQRRRLAAIRPQLVRRFYELLGGYLAICRTAGARPRYAALARHAFTLGHAPTLRQCVEMTASPDLKRRLSAFGRFVRLTSGAR